MFRPSHLCSQGLPLLSSLALTLAVSSCGLASYEEEPLRPERLIERQGAARMKAAERVAGRPFTLREAEALALLRDADLRRALVSYRAALALDEVATPLQDPRLSVGMNGAVGSGVNRRRVAPEVTGSVAVPLTRRRSRQDARDHALVDLAGRQAHAAARQALLRVRRLYAEASFAGEVQAATSSIQAAADETAAAADALARAGTVTAVDAMLLSLEATRAAGAALNAQLEFERARAALSQALALPAGSLDAETTHFDTVEDVASFPREDELAQRMIESSTVLDVLAARHDVAEAELALQIARQIQDLNVGAAFSPEPAEAFTILGLVLSGAVPLFARNRQAIASAASARRAASDRFAVMLDQQTAALSWALAGVERAQRSEVFLVSLMRPQAADAAAAADRAVRAGTASALSLLAVQRSQREVDLAAIRARHAVLRGWLQVETVAEIPILPAGDPANWYDWSPASSEAYEELNQ